MISLRRTPRDSKRNFLRRKEPISSTFPEKDNPERIDLLDLLLEEEEPLEVEEVSPEVEEEASEAEEEPLEVEEEHPEVDPEEDSEAEEEPPEEDPEVEEVK